MRLAIVIGATGADSPWLPDLLESVSTVTRWPVVVHETRAWELATIGWAAERYDEFVFLPQSTVVRDVGLFTRCFVDYAGKSVNLGTAQGGTFRMYLGKYRGPVALSIGIPAVADKWAAVSYESTWCEAYARAEAGNIVNLGRPLEHTTQFEERHGRTNMVVENEYLRRYKSCWDLESLGREVRRLAEQSGS